MMTTMSLEQQQEVFEQESLGLGVARYRKALERGEADMPPGMKLLKEAVVLTEKAITEWIEKALAGPARGMGAAHFLSDSQLTPQLVAYVTCKACINALGGIKVQTVAMNITKLLEDTANYAKLEAEDPKAYRQLMRKVAKSTSDAYRHVVMRKQQKYAGIKTIKWGTAERLRLGTLLIELCRVSTGLFDVVRETRGRNDTPVVLRGTQRTLEWLTSSHARCEVLDPVYLPMICPPRKWTTPFNGGYLTKALRFPLVKGANRNYLSDLANVDMPMVYNALNALQETRWRVNAGVLRLLTQVWDTGGGIGKLPSRDPEPLPPATFTDADAEARTPAFVAWKKAAAQTHERNANLVSKRLGMQQKLWVAERMSKHEAFHYVHALDFRGRTYAIGSYLTPQGDDSAKALLEFADGKPLGTNGAFWLAVHGANCFGVDKVSFDERVQWVQDNEEAILESAFNPLDGTRWWAQAASPWQFLAFCFEWSGMIMHHRAGRAIEDFVSHLPVGLDGACNGLQNFSAMLRDEVGGKATNLVPSEKPSDIYSQVAAEASALIDEAVAEGVEIAARWQGKVTRKVTKRNTMTVPYAVTEYGMRDQLLQEFRKIAEEDPACDPVFREATMADAAFIAKINYAAIGRVVVAARAAMDWLKEAALVVAADGLPVQWTSPSGFRVVQDYRKFLGTEFDFDVAGRRYRLTLKVETKKLNGRKQASGISPNFVHALDAAHMHRTVDTGVGRGITHFAMIHDSFGTHAADVETMASTLRDAFIEQYTPDVLGQFRDQLARLLPDDLREKLPPLPAFGTLDLEGIRSSDYFFA